MAGEAVLIVDDNPANLKLAEVTLRAEGYEVWTAVNGEAALEMLETFLPRLILMDLQLPGLGGLELTRQLKADPRTKDIPVLAVTAYAMVGDRQKVTAAGCDGYITKPIDTRTLPGMVAEHLVANRPRGVPPGERTTAPEEHAQ